MAEEPVAGERVLVVDDDAEVRALLERILARHRYRCTQAGDLAEARDWFSRAPFDLIICDVQLPDGSGLDLVEQALRRDEQMAALMVSGLGEVVLAERALTIGADGYILKPFTANDVLIRVLGALRHRRAEVSVREELRASQEETIQRLSMAVEARDPETAPHLNDMSELSWRIARQLGLPARECELIRAASPMHDLGKIGVPDQVLLKPGPLTPEERAEMQRHAEIGYRILSGSRSRLLQVAATIAWTHHERLDGSGYPRGLKGDEIPIEGLIAAVADVYDALTRDRVYRPAMSYSDALTMVKDGRGTEFDPTVVDAFLAVLDRKPARSPVTRVAAGPVSSPPRGGPPPPADLTPREREVLQLAADGRTAIEIASSLVVSPSTVKTHFQHIYEKLGVRDRAAAVAEALRAGRID